MSFVDSQTSAGGVWNKKFIGRDQVKEDPAAADLRANGSTFSGDREFSVPLFVLDRRKLIKVMGLGEDFYSPLIQRSCYDWAL